MHMTLTAVLAIVVSWAEKGGGQKRLAFGPNSVAAACAEAAKHPGAEVERLTRTPSLFTYAVMCYTPGCDRPPDSFDLEAVRCKHTPAQTREVTEPERWELVP